MKALIKAESPWASGLSVIYLRKFGTSFLLKLNLHEEPMQANGSRRMSYTSSECNAEAECQCNGLGYFTKGTISLGAERI